MNECFETVAVVMNMQTSTKGVVRDEQCEIGDDNPLNIFKIREVCLLGCV